MFPSRIRRNTVDSMHMTSHIFNAMGMWDDVVIANAKAKTNGEGNTALDLGEHEEAAAAFHEQLQRSRRKVKAVEGLARAEKVVDM